MENSDSGMHYGQKIIVTIWYRLMGSGQLAQGSVSPFSKSCEQLVMDIAQMRHFTNKHCVSTVCLCVSSIKKKHQSIQCLLRKLILRYFIRQRKVEEKRQKDRRKKATERREKKETERAKKKEVRKSKEKNYGAEAFANKLSKFQKRLD